MRFVVLFALFSFSTVIFASNSTCDHLVAEIERLSPRLAKLLSQKRFLEQIQTDDPTWDFVSQSIARAGHPLRTLKFSTEYTRITIKTSIDESGHMTIAIPYFKVAGVELRNRPKVVNRAFARLLAAIFDGVSSRIALGDRRVSSFTIVGENVINMHLGKILKSMGFRKQRLSERMRKLAFASLMMTGGAIAYLLGMELNGSELGSIRALTPVALGWSAVSTAIGGVMVLDFFGFVKGRHYSATIDLRPYQDDRDG